MADLVARVADLAHELGVDERGVARDEERRRHVVPLQQRQDPRHGHRTELAPRHRRHVAERHLVRPGRERVEVEGEADREPRRGHAASAATDSSSASRTPSIWVASAMLGCVALTGDFLGQARQVQEARRRAARGGRVQGGVHRRVAEEQAGALREIPRDAGRLPGRDDAPERQGREVRDGRTGLDRDVNGLRAVVVGIGEVEEVDRRALDREPRTPRARLRAGARASARSPRWPLARRPACARPRPAVPGRRPRDRRSRSHRALRRSARSGCARRLRSSGIRSGGGS